MTEEEVRHREAIRALVARFIMHTDHGRFADVAACFAVDGVARWRDGGGGTGRQEIEANLRIATANPAIRFVRHNLSAMQIELAADMRTATGIIHFFTLSNAGGDHAGVYYDRYVRNEDGWLIALRDVRLDWRAASSLYPPTVSA